jgi:neurotransmitter:Na+ symporter, NSS family
MKKYAARESWKSRIGFIFAAIGSAVGLGSIWRFPYVVGENGGGAFLITYIFCLLLIGFPVLIGEILIGRTTQTSPSGAFRILGRNKLWSYGGKMTIITGFIISSFYSVIAGWSLGYLVEAVRGNVSGFTTPALALEYFDRLSSSSVWCVGFHFIFMLLSLSILITGVRKGIEACSKIMMPILIIVLIFLVIKGLFMPGAMAGVKFLFTPDFNSLTAKGMLIALGQAFFTMSLGQGTMVTYGSYLSRSEDIPKSCFPVLLLNTFISILMGVAVFTIVFSVGATPSVGAPLIFETLPIVFSQLPWGYALSILFFLLVTLAALTSEISALEPVISYFIDEKGWGRKKSSIISVAAAFILGIPSALAFGVIKNVKVWGCNFFDIISSLSLNILVPVGGLVAVMLVAWRWGVNEAFDNLKVGDRPYFHSKPLLSLYFRITLKYISPILIVVILLHAIGVL